MADEERVERIPPRKYGKRRFRDGIDVYGRRKWSGMIEKAPVVIDKRTAPVQRTQVGDIETYDTPGEVEETMLGGGDPPPEKFKVTQQPPAKSPIESPTVIHEPAAAIYSKPEEEPVVMSAKDLTPPIDVEEESIVTNPEEEAAIESEVANILSEANETLESVEAKLEAVIEDGAEEYQENPVVMPEETVIDDRPEHYKATVEGAETKEVKPDITNFSSWDGDQKVDLTEDDTESRDLTKD